MGRIHKGAVYMGAGMLLIFLSFALMLWNIHCDRNAARSARAVIAQLDVRMPTPPTRALLPTVAVAQGEQSIGILEVPTLGLKLPVLRDCTDRALETAPCRYTGTAQEGTLVIAGENCRSHFGMLRGLAAGDTVYFTETDGKAYAYAVSALETVSDPVGMIAGDWDLTLFTGTFSGRGRVTVRCKSLAQ